MDTISVFTERVESLLYFYLKSISESHRRLENLIKLSKKISSIQPNKIDNELQIVSETHFFRKHLAGYPSVTASIPHFCINLLGNCLFICASR